jgi:hypothetical protein
MTVRPPVGIPLPELVLVGNRVLTEEAEALRSAMEHFGNAPQPGSPWVQDDETFGDRAPLLIPSRNKLLRYARHQASLIYANAWDHLVSLARILGGDGAMPLFSQASVSRVMCEAAVRFAWLMDPDVSSAARLVRGAAALYYSAEQRSKGVHAIPAASIESRFYQQMLDSCQHELNEVSKLIENAGMEFGYSRDGSTRVRVELRSPAASAPTKIDITQLMAGWLPESPSWYNVGSSVTHSIYWGLRDIDHSLPSEPPALTPDVVDVGAAVESALSASALIMDRCGRMNGHDPSSHVADARKRRKEVDILMRRAVTSAWAHISADPAHRVT